MVVLRRRGGVPCIQSLLSVLSLVFIANITALVVLLLLLLLLVSMSLIDLSYFLDGWCPIVNMYVSYRCVCVCVFPKGVSVCVSYRSLCVCFL